MNCVLCGDARWRALPVSVEGRSITTSGIMIAESLEREQCMTCGLLRKSLGRFLGNTSFYETGYENYYSRPGAAHYDKARYLAMAEWMKSALGDWRPQSILDVGCGAGWSMAATIAQYGDSTIEGVEPSLANSERARKAGFVVYSTRLGSGQDLSKKYDLIYANNVLQHVIDPVGFLQDLSHHLSSDGRIVFILPDAGEPSNEMMWCDHNFSFRAADIVSLAKKAGVQVLTWLPNPPNNTLLNKQLVVLRKFDGVMFGKSPENAHSVKELFDRRAGYCLKWRSLDGVMERRTAQFERVYNFGGSMWTWLLAGYCPKYWNRVEACLVDSEHGQAAGKAVLPPSELSFGNKDCVVLGINPVNQSEFAKKNIGLGVNIISWDDQITI
jgi:trans-aconitate methyltransferase